ncbi:MAG TPA: thiamine pyrophosphate-binding protein, partial [Chloroflexota bacterium]
MIGAELLTECLRSAGVTFVSTIVGNGINPFLQAAREQGFRVLDTRNEQTACYMADAYARLTRRVGVCAVSASVGHTNALTGLLNARLDGSPVLLISGSADHRYTDRGKFQDFDQVATAVPICKYARLVDHPEKIVFYLREALAHAVSGRPGPVHLTVPQDVLEAEVPEQWMDPRAFSMLGVVRPNSPAPTDLVAQGARLIEEAERPVLVAGSGVFYSGGAAALARLAGSARIPVVVPIWDRGSVESRVPEFAGVVGAYSGGPDLLKDADLAILVGARVDYRLGYLDVPEVSAGLRVLRIDSDPVELHQGFEPNLAIQGDPKSVLEQITDQLSWETGERHAVWLEETKRRDVAFRRRLQSDAYTSSSPTGWHVVQALRPLVDNGAVLVVDGG